MVKKKKWISTEAFGLSLFLLLLPKLGQKQKERTFFHLSAIYNSNLEMGPGGEIGNNLAKVKSVWLPLFLFTSLSY
jgi:hypothetical protein